MIPVVFLHGIGGGARSFAPQIASFAARGYQPVALDLLGYGGRPSADTMTFDALAEDVEAGIAKSALDRPVLVGHSMGGMVVQTLLRRRPDGYRAAVLSCTSPAFGNPAGDFQRKFVADRLAPLDAGKTMADAAPGAADERVIAVAADHDVGAHLAERAHKAEAPRIQQHAVDADRRAGQRGGGSGPDGCG